jgi:hypothetical protein
MEGKICNKCKEYKLLEEFGRKKTGKFGRNSHCKKCVSEQKTEYYTTNKELIIKKQNNYMSNNKDKISKRKSEYYINNKERITKTQAKYRVKNKEKIAKKQAEWVKNNPEKTAARAVRRRVILGNSEVAWGNNNKIKEIYEERDRLRESTGEEYHVDHIIPLNHPDVCGLHVEYNLQILTAEENLKKSNKFRRSS